MPGGRVAFRDQGGNKVAVFAGLLELVRKACYVNVLAINMRHLEAGNQVLQVALAAFDAVFAGLSGKKLHLVVDDFVVVVLGCFLGVNFFAINVDADDLHDEFGQAGQLLGLASQAVLRVQGVDQHGALCGQHARVAQKHRRIVGHASEERDHVGKAAVPEVGELGTDASQRLGGLNKGVDRAGRPRDDQLAVKQGLFRVVAQPDDDFGRLAERAHQLDRRAGLGDKLVKQRRLFELVHKRRCASRSRKNVLVQLDDAARVDFQSFEQTGNAWQRVAHGPPRQVVFQSGVARRDLFHVVPCVELVQLQVGHRDGAVAHACAEAVPRGQGFGNDELDQVGRKLGLLVHHVQEAR